MTHVEVFRACDEIISTDSGNAEYEKMDKSSSTNLTKKTNFTPRAKSEPQGSAQTQG